MIWVAGQQLYGRRYIIEREIGRGGFGITYLAKDRNGKPLVIKTLKDEVMTSPDYTEFRDKYQRDFEREATRLAVCRHPHIVQIENVFHEQSLPCIAMEYIQGENLWRRVRGNSPLSEAEALSYIQQIGEALTLVHEKGLLHRDLKPQNIMVRSGVSEAVLIDFGIAREFIPNLTQTHSVHVTPGFAPIEQYDEQAHRGEYTDVYGLAATLYCLLTTKVPPPAFMRMVRDSLVPPNQVNHTVCDGVNHAILKGMSLQPENRPQSVQEWLKLFQLDSKATITQLSTPAIPLPSILTNTDIKWRSNILDNKREKGDKERVVFRLPPPIASGRILQDRYRLVRVLGQDGFGRTYLAEDLNRFNELCALKELIPPQTEANGLSKARELFQREATTLYQIQHPQVPKFRENFEQDGRLFLVQDYVEGKTYHELLNERIAQLNAPSVQPPPESSFPSPTQLSALGQSVFSEAEVKQLLLQLLPVLEHVHSRGIIHRDITPDNIIQRSSDQMPVLIDFSVFKELATRFQNPGVATPATTVGKLGYAPSEQIKTGRSYPSSDIYSLAVTAVVLLTGKEPQELLDNTQLTWNWRRWANVSDDFAQVLNRMLSYRPGDRYQSAIEVQREVLVDKSDACQASPQQQSVSKPFWKRFVDNFLDGV